MGGDRDGREVEWRCSGEVVKGNVFDGMGWKG